MFKNLLKRKKSAQPEHEAPRLAHGISEAILQTVGAKALPPMPGAAQKAFQLATDPKADARDFVEVIESDEGLTARVLKIANSVYFDRGKKSATIEEAVMVIGINELRSLLNATTLSEIFPSRHPARSQLWSNDIGTAICSRVLAQRFIPAKAELAFLGGLMHDIGKLLLLQRSADGYAKVLKKVEQEGKMFCAAETDLFVFNHTEVGQLVAERWNFTPEIVAIIRRHHDPWSDLMTEGVSLPAIIKAADTVCHSLGIGHQRGFHRLQGFYERQLDQSWEALGVAGAERRELVSALQRAYNDEQELYAGAAAEQP